MTDKSTRICGKYYKGNLKGMYRLKICNVNEIRYYILLVLYFEKLLTFNKFRAAINYWYLYVLCKIEVRSNTFLKFFVVHQMYEV